MSLQAAHRGYEYQDLLSAARLVDVLLGTLAEARVDEKLVAGDRFDDLTTVDIRGRRERTQFKHTDNDDRPLTLTTFTDDRRGLQLDRLVASAVADRDGPGTGAESLAFRVVLRDARPVDSALLAVLRPAAPDPGPFLTGMNTVRMRFDPDALWPVTLPDEGRLGEARPPFAFLWQSSVPRADLVWVCERLVVEVEAPAATADLTAPGPAEHLLLDRAHREVGAGLYPNTDRSPLDVAEALIRTARAARQGRIRVSAGELMRRSQLRHDFGAVAKAHPVDRTMEVRRPVTIGTLAEAARAAAGQGVPLLIVGPPGQGKSWACQQLIEHLQATNWLVAEHYCYLGDADEERLARVYAETIFGSLLGRLADVDPALVTDQRPRFAASHEALEDAIRRATRADADRPVALVVDGVDHVSRVQPGLRGADPSRTLAEELAALDLPRDSVLIVLGQPGEHLRALQDAGAIVMPVPALSEGELRVLAERLGVIPAPAEVSLMHSGRAPLLLDAAAASEFVEALTARSTGNALYATYLCREASRRTGTLVDPAAAVRALPPFDDALAGYYQHLYQTLGSDGAWVADVLAVLDFAVTRAELCEIRPDTAHRVDDALAVLGPVLVERATQGGVRVYHESFARFLRQPFQQNPPALTAVLDRVVAWLQAKGFFEEERAFRFLIPTLASAGRDHEVVDLVDHMFLARSVAAGYPASAIVGNLVTVIGCAARVGDWPAIVQCVELARGAATYEYERFDSALAEFVDVPMSVLGAEVFASRLLFDGRPVVSGRAGLLLCAAVDAYGGVAPWREYMTAYLHERERDNTAYGRESEQDIGVAWMRGRLRLSAAKEFSDPTAAASATPSSSSPSPDNVEAGTDSPGRQRVTDFSDAVVMSRLAEHIEENDLPAAAVVAALVDTRGMAAATSVVAHLRNPGPLALAVAEEIAVSDDLNGGYSAQRWAAEAAGYGVPPGAVHRLLALGVPVERLLHGSPPEARERLLTLTRRVQDRSVRWESGVVNEWLDACTVAARQDPLGLTAAEASVTGAGWYRCWLRFVIALVTTETAAAIERPTLAVEALRLLTEDLNPFAGDPRACDLYPIHAEIDDTIRRAVALLDDSTWPEALQILERVSDKITTTLQGELGGPLPADRLLAFAIDATTTTARRPATLALIERTIEQDAASRYYVDLAEYRLVAARFALRCGDTDAVARWWTVACQMLTAYGWHKDITIYELLDPLPTLVHVDPPRGRERVAQVQPLCERIPFHTDGKETRHAWAVWWELLAQADPAALARLTGPTLMDKCNLPNSLLNGARRDLWRAWHHRADPVVGGLLRLSLDMPLDPADPDALDRLVDVADAPDQLLTLLLARVDERSVVYTVTNSSEMLNRDAQRVDAINAVAARAGAPPITPIPLAGSADKPAEPSRPWGSRQQPTPPPDLANDRTPRLFPAGVAGVAAAARAWRGRPYDSTGSEWSTDRFANIIGYRLIELVREDDDGDAETSLRAVADAADLGDRAGLLTALADGIERHGHTRLAAVAHTLAWTRTRGGGGWRHFGAKTRIDSLRRAMTLNAAVALSVIAAEVQRAVASNQGGTYGMSQALIYAFATLDMLSRGDSEPDVAFDCWDQAAAVIAARAPRVHPYDDPDQPYTAPKPDGGTDVVGDLDAAYAIATLAGVADPEREGKRRTLLAVQLLIKHRPELAAVAFGALLPALGDPGTLVWLLRLLEQAAGSANPIVERCSATLAHLAAGPHLTVRALARRLLDTNSLPNLPTASPDEVLLQHARTSRIWTPADGAPESAEPDDDLAEVIDEVAGTRLAEAEIILPGLRDAVRTRVAKTVTEDRYQRRMRKQFDALADKTRKRMPDAYLAIEEAIEDALQRAAAGGRAARLAAGQPIGDPAVWEDRLAEALLDDPAVPLAIEATRQPRPALPAPPGFEDPAWVALRAYAHQANQPSGFDVAAAAERRGVLSGTLAIGSAGTAATVDGGRFDGWRLVASVEKRALTPSDFRKPNLQAHRYRALEIRRPGDTQALNTPPFADGDQRIWSIPISFASGLTLPTASQPLFGLDTDSDSFGDSPHGLGIHEPLLTPIPSLLLPLRLRPDEPLLLKDDQGPALALITWRTEYDTSDYHQAWPRLQGAAILLRADLHTQLQAQAGDRLVLRDFVLGSSGLANAGGEPQPPDEAV